MNPQRRTHDNDHRDIAGGDDLITLPRSPHCYASRPPPCGTGATKEPGHAASASADTSATTAPMSTTWLHDQRAAGGPGAA